MLLPFLIDQNQIGGKFRLDGQLLEFLHVVVAEGTDAVTTIDGHHQTDEFSFKRQRNGHQRQNRARLHSQIDLFVLCREYQRFTRFKHTAEYALAADDRFAFEMGRPIMRIFENLVLQRIIVHRGRIRLFLTFVKNRKHGGACGAF